LKTEDLEWWRQERETKRYATFISLLQLASI